MRRASVVVLLAFLFAISALADDREQSKAILAKVDEVSNFSEKDAKPFQMKVAFQAHMQAGDLDGRYSLYWKSKDQSRVEAELGRFKESVVREPDKSWRSSSLALTPEPIGDVARLINQFQNPDSGGLGHFSKFQDPQYPPGAPGGDHIVVLHALISAGGDVTAAQVRTSSGREFDREALLAVQKWKFKPASCIGEPIEVEIDIEIKFRLGLQ